MDNSTALQIRPITPDDLPLIPTRCWPAPDAIRHLFATQETIGMAAWESGRCVSELHCYRIDDPANLPPDLPWSGWWGGKWPKALAGLRGPFWCHACFHVGRTFKSAANESIQRRRSGPNFLNGIEPAYLGRGIGTRLAQRSVQWAREHAYHAVVAPGAPAGLKQFALWSGDLSATTYERLGFGAAGDGFDPVHESVPPEVRAEVDHTAASGRPANELRERWMLLNLP